MAKKSAGPFTLYLTQRSLCDLVAIEVFSIEQFGK